MLYPVPGKLLPPAAVSPNKTVLQKLINLRVLGPAGVGCPCNDYNYKGLLCDSFVGSVLLYSAL